MTYKYVHRPLSEIASALNVDAVVEGSVSRTGEQVHVNAQLIDARSDRHIWAESYDENTRDVLSLQSNVARAIAEQIRVTMKPQEQATLWKTQTLNPDAYQTYLKGRYFWNQRTRDGLQTAIDYFTRAVLIDPARSIALSARSLLFTANLGSVYAVSGREEEAKKIIDDLQSQHDQHTSADAYIAMIYVGLGDHDAAMTWLNEAYEARFKASILLHPTFDPLRSDVRFQNLLQRIGLPTSKN